MATPSPVEDPQAWAFVWLGGEMIPAAAEITGAPGWDIDAKKAKGSDGYSIQDNGIKPAQHTLKLTYVPKFWAKVEEILNRVAPPQLGGKRKPVEIKNARTASRGIHSVYVESVSLPEVDDNGMMSQTLSLMQWVAEPKPTKAAAGSGSKTPKSGTDRDPFKDGSFVQPLYKPYYPEVLAHGSKADKDFADFMQNAI